MSNDLHKQILCGYLTVKADVASVKDSTVHFSDGTQEDDIDIIMVATGYDYTYVQFTAIKVPLFMYNSNSVVSHAYCFGWLRDASV